jgi:competence protein ComFC
MGIIDIIFPKSCLGCGAAGLYLCKNCISKVLEQTQTCIYCKKPSIDGLTHTKCSGEHSLMGVTTLWKYSGVIKKAIHSMKYKYATTIGEELSEYIKREIDIKYFPEVSFVCPVPIHWYKENSRGFNQSAIIGQMISSYLGKPFMGDLLVKTRSTVSQTFLTRDARRTNIKGVFKINQEKIPDVKLGNIVLLVDDVLTTGSTIIEAGRVLSRSGFRVWALTVCR